MSKRDFFFVLDVESVGLYGKNFAVGYVVLDRHGNEVDGALLACAASAVGGSEESMEWIAEHVPPLDITHDSPRSMRDDFWKAWLYWKARGASMYADVGFPVEALFLIDCVMQNPMREKDAPYPLYDVSSFIAASGADPMLDYERYDSELPAHNPLADARQSGRLLMEALGIKSLVVEPEEVSGDPPIERPYEPSTERELLEILDEWNPE